MIKTLIEITGSFLQLYLDVYNYNILIKGNEVSLMEKLKEEFHFFVSQMAPKPKATVEFHLQAPPAVAGLVANKITESAAVYRMGPIQYVDYFGEALTIWNHDLDQLDIHCADPERLYELTFLAIHSLLGQKLDALGFCRVHAMAVSLEKLNALVMLPSKGGKSTLLSYLLENPEIKIISDDMPIIDSHGGVHPFPSKVSLSHVPDSGLFSKLTWQQFNRHQYPPKWTASLSQLKERIATQSAQNKNILIAGFRLSGGDSLLTPVAKWKMAGPLLEHMIIGFGLPQILELFLKFHWTDIFKLIGLGFKRSMCALQLVAKSDCCYFYLGPDRAYNAQLLMEYLYEHQPS